MLEEQIQMVDLHGQYLRFKEEIDEAMQAVIDSCAFMEYLAEFEKRGIQLYEETYQNAYEVMTSGN